MLLQSEQNFFFYYGKMIEITWRHNYLIKTFLKKTTQHSSFVSKNNWVSLHVAEGLNRLPKVAGGRGIDLFFFNGNGIFMRFTVWDYPFEAFLLSWIVCDEDYPEESNIPWRSFLEAGWNKVTVTGVFVLQLNTPCCRNERAWDWNTAAGNILKSSTRDWSRWSTFCAADARNVSFASFSSVGERNNSLLLNCQISSQETLLALCALNGSMAPTASKYPQRSSSVWCRC